MPSEHDMEQRQRKSVDLGGRRIIKKKKYLVPGTVAAQIVSVQTLAKGLVKKKCLALEFSSEMSKSTLSKIQWDSLH